MLLRSSQKHAMANAVMMLVIACNLSGLPQDDDTLELFQVVGVSVR